MGALGQRHFRRNTLRVPRRPCPKVLKRIIIRVARSGSIQLHFRSIRTSAFHKLICACIRHRGTVHNIEALDQAGRYQAEIGIGGVVGPIRASRQGLQVLEEGHTVRRISIGPDPLG